MIRVVIAEDSATSRELLVSILAADPDVEVVGVARDGAQAVAMTAELRPDVVVMDIRMPVMDGFEATRRIMIAQPTPIVIVSAVVDTRDVEVSMQALTAGALTAMPKPPGPASPQFEEQARRFVETVRSMSQVKVVRRFPQRRSTRTTPPKHVGPRPEVVAVAASTGGPAALKCLLGGLPAELPVPLLIVQHLARGFAPGFVSWLDGAVPLRVMEARDGAHLQAGTALVAPDDAHLWLDSRRIVRLRDTAPVGGFRPSANMLFESVAEAYGRRAMALILTGMGRDGVDGLRIVRERGGVVFAQDRESCVVFGMPGEAVEAGLAHDVMPPSEMARRLTELFGQLR